MKHLFLGLFIGFNLLAQPPLPRPAPELKAKDAYGRTIKLSDFRGRTVLLAFISTQCGHCQQASQEFEGLSREFKDKLQVMEAAFDDGADIGAFAKKFALTSAIGKVSREETCSFLGLSAKSLLGTPQVVIIDRKGMIRAQSERLGTPILQTSDYLRSLLQAVMR